MFSINNFKYIVGLGNPSLSFMTSPHNLGFIFVDMLVRRLHDVEKRKLNKQTLWKFDDKIISKPNTYMNRSGDAIYELYNKEHNGSLVDFVCSLLIIHDDVELGMYLIKDKDGQKHKGLGAHNGLRSVVSALNHLGLKSDEAHSFHRLRLGCNSIERVKLQLSDYVTKPMPQEILSVWIEKIDQFLSADGFVLVN